jgi:precorrin-8X/cobalt-precorrin-8 methylmutase
VNAVHPIEAESYRIVAARADLSGFGPLGAAVVARVIHASADVDYARTMVVDEAAAAAGVAALRTGAPVVVDVEMVRHGIADVTSHCHLGDAVGGDGLTRTAAAMRLAARRHGSGAVVVVGCAPTALAEVVRQHLEEGFRPALVVGLPVGFVGAAEAKAALRATRIPSISNVGDKGGSAVASAAFNALWRLARG